MGVRVPLREDLPLEDNTGSQDRGLHQEHLLDQVDILNHLDQEVQEDIVLVVNIIIIKASHIDKAEIDKEE